MAASRLVNTKRLWRSSIETEGDMEVRTRGLMVFAAAAIVMGVCSWCVFVRPGESIHACIAVLLLELGLANLYLVWCLKQCGSASPECKSRCLGRYPVLVNALILLTAVICLGMKFLLHVR